MQARSSGKANGGVKGASRVAQPRRRAKTGVLPDGFFLDMADALPGCISFIGPDKRYHFVNKTYEVWFGLSREQMIGKSPREILGEAAFKKIGPVIADAFAGTPRTHETVVPRSDGGVRHIISSLIPSTDEDGRVCGVYVLSTDISERKQAEEALRSSEERFLSAFQNAPIGMALVSLEGQVMLPNLALCELLGYSRRGLTNKSVALLTHPDDIEKTRREKERLLEDPSAPARYEKRFVSAQSKAVWVQLSVSLVTGARGKPQYYIYQVEDIAKRKAQERSLRKAKALAEGASRAKSEFLANISHEFRSPLNSVLGYTHLLLDGFEGPLTREQKRSLERVEAGAGHLLHLVEDLLDLSGIESGKTSIKKVSFHLRKCLDETLGSHKALAQERGLAFKWTVRKDVPRRLHGDPERLRQVLTNLADNALKFTSEGGVKVTVEERSRGKRNVTLQFTVEDTGIGIPEEEQHSIFGSFVQVDGSTTRTFEGLGLGLAIASNLVSQMKGRIRVESEAGQGSSFIFTASFGLVD